MTWSREDDAIVSSSRAHKCQELSRPVPGDIMHTCCNELTVLLRVLNVFFGWELGQLYDNFETHICEKSGAGHLLKARQAWVCGKVGKVSLDEIFSNTKLRWRYIYIFG